MVESKVKFDKDVVLSGNGGISQDLIPQVAQILEDTFKFEDLTQKGDNGYEYKNLIINSDVENIKPFLDSEPKMRQEKKRIQESYRNKYVYIVQYSKVVDNRLRDSVLELEERIRQLDLKDPKLLESVESLRYLGLPDINAKVAARFTSSRFNPSIMKEQLIGQIYAVKMGEPSHIGVVMPKTIFEWSHNFLKKWREKHVYEMPAWHMLLEDIVRRNGTGANSIIINHPHAPKEGLEKSRSLNLNYVMLHPQTFTVSSNGWIYSIDKFMGQFGIDVSAPEFDPIHAKIDEEKEALGKYKDLAHLFIYVAAVDKGSENNAERVANKYGLSYIKSLKDRHREGHSQITEADNIGKYLGELKSREITDATITVYIPDDMGNTLGTADEQAILRDQQVEEFNREYGTDYKLKVKLLITHMRSPELDVIKHNRIDEIIFFNTVPYLPTIEEQFERIGITDKITIIQSTPYQLAMEIAVDYFAQKMHYASERHLENLEAKWYRDNTDKNLVKFGGFGQDLNNLMRYLD